MKYGIYYAYWAKNWGADYNPYIDKVASLGYDILEISCAGLKDINNSDLKALRSHAEDKGITLTAGYGPSPEQSIASPDSHIVAEGFKFWRETFRALQALGIKSVAGGLYGCWPVNYFQPIDKEGDLERSITNMKNLADVAGDYGIDTLGMEVLNRHEGYMLNTAQEAVNYCRAVDRPNVKVHLDTYHMLLEEDSFTDAIHTAGKMLGHFHVGENNRKLPGQGHIIDWNEIGRALRDVGYTGNVVAEPFVLKGGEVGRDIRLWRDMFHGITEQELDRQAEESVKFLREKFERA